MCYFVIPLHGDVIKWKPLSRYRPFVRGIHWSGVGSTHKGHCSELWCLFDPCLNRRLSNQSRHRWFATPLRSVWCHCNGTSIMNFTWYSNINLRWATDHLIWFDDIRPFNYTEVIECFSGCFLFSRKLNCLELCDILISRFETFRGSKSSFAG